MSAIAVRAEDRTAIVVTGKDRTSWLNGLVTCDLAKLGPGEGAYGLLVEKKGRIQTDFFAVPSAENDALALVVPKDLAASLVATLDHYLIMEDAELEQRDLPFWQVWGEAPPSGAFGGTIRALGLSVTSAEPAGVTLVDAATWDAHRIERGVPKFGVEFDTTMYPQEAALEKLAVSFDKGCYLGQEVVYMLENRGHVKKKLVPLDLASPVEKGAAITSDDGAAIGDIRSSAVGPISGKPVALGMVKWAFAKAGTSVRVGDVVAHVR